jgi:cytochrome c biogenesis protein CcmG/thiol:disulfide interchange protein DsbE
MLASAGVALAAGCLLAFPATRAFASRCVDACGQLVWRTPAVAPPGKLAPDFTLDDADGHPVSLSSFRGKAVLLNFWATWCNPCAVEIPWFVEFERAYREQGLVVLGVSLDEDGWQAIRPFVAARRINYRILLGGDPIADLFGGIQSLPSTLIIGRDGRIAATHVGLASKSTYEAAIQAALKK